MAFKNPFSKPTPYQLAADELAEAQRKLLEAQTGLEYAKAMVEYNTNRVARLQKFVSDVPKSNNKTEAAI